jgi:NADH-quinone oxidoreductase subunit M
MDHDHSCPPISLPERLGALLLLAASVWIGLWPGRMIEAISRSFDSPLFDALKKGGWR